MISLAYAAVDDVIRDLNTQLKIDSEDHNFFYERYAEEVDGNNVELLLNLHTQLVCYSLKGI